MASALLTLAQRSSPEAPQPANATYDEMDTESRDEEPEFRFRSVPDRPPALRPEDARPVTLTPTVERPNPEPRVIGASSDQGGGGANRSLVAALGVAAVLLLAAGWFGYASHTNSKVAAEWKQRSIELEEQVNGLRTLIGERSAQLNERTRQANRLAANLRSTRGALVRSEDDVSSLAQRQRELANEKAQLEDLRRALQQQASDLTDVASRYISCKSSLIDVINALIDQDYSSARYAIDVANSRCDSASSALNAYVAAYE
jgi:hypothetical protein